ncbi:MAG: SsrA-binding protein SmpB [Candidatus Magasanikbacteria bacterium]|nr:SsrA-binding protein SmpB [Candidatus Magasanikbacteria bacterium]
MPIYAINKYAKYDYDILETAEAGLVLSGPEVKSIRLKQINLKGAYISFLQDGAYLKQAHISPYRFSGDKEQYTANRDRKILLHKKEMAYLRSKTQEKGLTIVPISVYTKGPNIKLEIGVARGKKLYDKRAVIKKREQNREIHRSVKYG